MRTITILFLAMLLLPVQAIPQSGAENPLTGNTVIIDPAKTMQSIAGWGSSLCWWAGQVGNWDEAKIDSIVEIITSPDHLNMNIFRYNIGGGDDPSHAGGHMVKGKGKRAEMEGFRATKESPCNWNADKAQRTIMLKIREKRPDAVFEAFSNSPPYWMTYSGCSAGNDDAGKDNLKPEYYAAFCDYLVDVCKHYKEVYGIEFKTLEPFNESTSHYWYNQGSQEGCHFNPETQMKIIRKLYPKLQASGLKTVISASDETNIASFIRVLKAYSEAGDILDKIGQLNTHTYSGSNRERSEAQQLVKATGKEFWQSETGPGGWKERAGGFKNNLLLARKMFDDLNIMQPQAWLDWQLMEEHNDTWCLMRCDFKTQQYDLVKNLYVRMQITKFIKQGYTLLSTDCESSLVAISPDKNKVVVALNNPGDRENLFLIDTGKLITEVNKMEVYRTSTTENCDKILFQSVKGCNIDYTAPGLSLTTFIFTLN
ncbi:MAG: glycoside hydrolase family 30 protein [Draconibacterium sp.]